MASNFKMDDQYLKEMGKFLKENAEALDDSFDNYLKILDKILSDAVMEGDMHNQLAQFRNLAYQLKDRIEPIGTLGNQMCKDFKKDISVNDTY